MSGLPASRAVSAQSLVGPELRCPPLRLIVGDDPDPAGLLGAQVATVDLAFHRVPGCPGELGNLRRAEHPIIIKGLRLIEQLRYGCTMKRNHRAAGSHTGFEARAFALGGHADAAPACQVRTSPARAEAGRGDGNSYPGAGRLAPRPATRKTA